MAGWKEMVKQNTLSISEEGVSAVRVFTWTPDGTETLPAVGDSWAGTTDDALTDYLYVKNMQRSFAGDTPAVRSWQVNYAGNKPSADGTSFDDQLKSADISGEFLNIGCPVGVYWSDGTPVKQDLFKRVATCAVKIPKVFSSFNTFLDSVTQCAGCVNSVKFLDREISQVLFSGANCTEFKNSKGVRRWRAEMMFDVRRPILDTDPVTYGNWQYLWNETAHKWMTTSEDIYDKRDFATILFPVSME